MYDEFLEWVRDNYSEPEYTKVLDDYVQSGEYPERFMDFKCGEEL